MLRWGAGRLYETSRTPRDLLRLVYRVHGDAADHVSLLDPSAIQVADALALIQGGVRAWVVGGVPMWGPHAPPCASRRAVAVVTFEVPHLEVCDQHVVDQSPRRTLVNSNELAVGLWWRLQHKLLARSSGKGRGGVTGSRP